MTTTPDAVTTEAPSETAALFASVSDDEAINRSLSAEKGYIRSKLENESCVTDWAPWNPVGEKYGTVVERRPDGVYVDVQHPYTYGSDNDTGDFTSEATYRVTENETVRVGGDENLAPCSVE